MIWRPAHLKTITFSLRTNKWIDYIIVTQLVLFQHKPKQNNKLQYKKDTESKQNQNLWKRIFSWLGNDYLSNNLFPVKNFTFHFLWYICLAKESSLSLTATLLEIFFSYFQSLYLLWSYMYWLVWKFTKQTHSVLTNTLFVSAGFIDFMPICARLKWVASDFMETAKWSSTQVARWA